MHFDMRRTRIEHGESELLRRNLVNLKFPAGCTHFEILSAIAHSGEKPLGVNFLSEELKVVKYPRGRTVFGPVAREIDIIVSNYPSLRWWMTRDGLVVDKVGSELDKLPHFVRLIGELSCEHVRDGRLSREALLVIAQRLDEEGFKLKEHLQPKEWEGIVALNRKRTGTKIDSFALAVKQPHLARGVRRLIYRARDRYHKADSSSSVIV